jgi:predicted nucleic acid-binding protein
MSIGESGKIKEVLNLHNTKLFLSAFDFLPVPLSAIDLSIDLMKKHNLLPNDAIILASCILQRIKVLASYDTDFAKACQAENILLLTNELDWQNIK